MSKVERLDIYHHLVTEPDPRLDTILDKINKLSISIITNKDTVMATLQDITDAVAAEKTVEDSIVALLNHVAADLSAALANGSDPVAIQSVVDTITANTAALAAAVTANTAPVVVPDPAPADPAPVDPAAVP